jgi:hypothetical protein
MLSRRLHRGAAARAVVRPGVLAIALGAMIGGLTGCASSASPEQQPAEQTTLRMAPERVFDAERPFIRGDPVGIELHWWVTRDTEGDIARALAPYDQPPEFLGEFTRERLRLSGLRVVAVPLSEVFVVHQIAGPSSPWSRRWLGQSPDWLQLVRSRRVSAGTRAEVYASEQRLPEGVLRLLGRGWIVPQRVEREAGAAIEAAMRLEVVGQVQQRDPATEDRNAFAVPSIDSVTPDLAAQGQLIEELLLEITVPAGYAIVLTAAPPEADWSSVDGITRDNLIEELQRREAGAADAPTEGADGSGDGQQRFGPSAPSAPPSDVPADATDEATQVFETLDAPMPSLADAFGPRATPIPTVGQLLLESRDRLSRPMRAVVILIPRLPEEFRLLP